MENEFKINNFNLIRLLAALQVAFQHSLDHLKVPHDWSINDLSEILPGVPIFFFVSGFLISKAYENNPVNAEYFRNRVLRIYPALIVCTFAALLTVFLVGYFSNISVQLLHVLLWIAGQISFVQFYSPEFMRGFGTGVLNGSLWTITVELQFYLLTPVVYWIIRQKNSKTRIPLLIFLIIMFLAVNIAYNGFSGPAQDSLLYKLWRVSFTPWFYMFLVGVLFQKNFDILYRIFHGKFFLVAMIYVPFAYLDVNYLGHYVGNGIGPMLFLMLALLIFSCAYSFPDIGSRLLGRNDLSYGLYIYHIPVVNLFIYYGYVSSLSYVFAVLGLTILAASFSWVLVEKPTLRLKKKTLISLQKD